MSRVKKLSALLKIPPVRLFVLHLSGPTRLQFNFHHEKIFRACGKASCMFLCRKI